MIIASTENINNTIRTINFAPPSQVLISYDAFNDSNKK